MLVRNLRNMNQAIYAGLQLYERAKRHHTYNLAFYDGTNCVFVHSQFPGVHVRILQGKADFAFFLVYIQNENFYRLTFFQNLSGIGNSAPAHFGNMNQTINTAQIHKRAEICQSAYRTSDLGACFDCFKQRCTLRCNLLFHKSLSSADNAALYPVHLNDVEFQILTLEHAQVFDKSIGNLGRRDKYSHAVHHCDQAALYNVCDSACHNRFIVKGRFNLLHALLFFDTLSGQEYIAVAIVHANNEYLDLIARLNCLTGNYCDISAELASGDNTIRFEAQVYGNFLVYNLNYGAFYNIARMQGHEGIFQHLFKCRFLTSS